MFGVWFWVFVLIYIVLVKLNLVDFQVFESFFDGFLNRSRNVGVQFSGQFLYFFGLCVQCVELLVGKCGLQFDGFSQGFYGYDVFDEGEGGISVCFGGIDGFVVEFNYVLMGCFEGVFYQIGCIFSGGFDFGVSVVSVFDVFFGCFMECNWNFYFWYCECFEIWECSSWGWSSFGFGGVGFWGWFSSCCFSYDFIFQSLDVIIGEFEICWLIVGGFCCYLQF